MEYFDSKMGLYHYFVCHRDDYFITNTLEKLDYHEYLYRLLLDKGYTRIIFLDEINEFVGKTEIQGNRAFTFDEDSYEFYSHPKKNNEKEQKLNTPKRQPDNEKTLTEETKRIKYYKKISSKPLDDPERIGAEIVNHIIPALQLKKEKVAIIMSIDLIKGMKNNSKTHSSGDVDYDLNYVLRQFNSAYEKQNLNNILIFTMKENGEFEDFSEFFGMLRCLKELHFNPQKSDLEINLNILRKAKIYVEVNKKIGQDEIINLILRKKMKLDDANNDISLFDNVIYSKIPVYAKYISKYIDEKFSASTFPIKQCEECLKDEHFINEMVTACDTVRYSDVVEYDGVENAYTLERVTGGKKIKKRISMEEIEERFADFIGLQKVKQCVIKQYNMLEAQKKRKKVGVNTNFKQGLNFIFTGNPGTGKTEMARLIGQIFCDMGLFDKQGKFIEVNRHNLIGEYQGHTAKNVEKVFNEAIGGVLFIDEIYALINDKNDTFGIEAVNTLVPLIENHSGELVVILAGYENKMVEFMKSNDGLNSRFKEDQRYHFSDYSEKELFEIGMKMIDKQCLTFTEDGKKEFEKQIKLMKKRAVSTSGNGRMIRNFVESVINRQSNRIATTDVKDADILLILKEDIVSKQKVNKKFDFEKEFNNIIGLSSVKEKIKEQHSILIANEKRNDAGIEIDHRQSLNFVFSGNPGTGKNKIGEVVARMLNDMGITDKREMIYTTKGDFIAEHLGGTPQKTRNQFESAIGGVLFIDEVYSFATGGEYGQESIDTLVPLLENNRGDVVVILAGYPEKMENFFSKNPGLKSRFPERLRINFPDYSAEELIEIGYVMIKESGFIIDKSAKGIFEKNIKILKENSSSDSGNARMIRNMIEDIITRQSTRIANNDVEVNELNLIIESDIICEADDATFDETIPFAVTKKQMEMLPDFYAYKKGENDAPESELLRKTEMSILYLEVEFGSHKGYGTGFFIHPDGYILTCNHVIKTKDGQLADKIVARMRYPGRPGGEDSYHNCVVVKTFEDLDMALLKTTEGSNFPYLKLAQPEHEVKEFDEFILPGYPMGELTKTGLSTYTCKISSVQRNPSGNGIDRYNIQGEAKKGNSGSPAISLETGEVIGLLPGAIQAYEGDYEEINYLRPIRYFWERFFD